MTKFYSRKDSDRDKESRELSSLNTEEIGRGEGVDLFVKTSNACNSTIMQ